ncbi:MAG: YceD family protein [Turicibacter sp.]|nr:YceD family protein [Turicibacter sp.]
MKWAIAQLIKQGSEVFEVHETVDFSKLLKPNDEIRHISPVKVDGTGQLQGKKVVFNLHIEGEMTLGCALTLDDVPYPFEADLFEIFVLDSEAYDEETDDILVTSTVLELAPVIWQNIYLQKPLRVVKDGAYEELKKQGIELESEEDLLTEATSEERVDPRLAVLSKLLGDKE